MHLPPPSEAVTYNEGTLMKVLGALVASGLTHEGAVAAINEMLNAGILFRERPKVGIVTSTCRSADASI